MIREDGSLELPNPDPGRCEWRDRKVFDSREPAIYRVYPCPENATGRETYGHFFCAAHEQQYLDNLEPGDSNIADERYP